MFLVIGAMSSIATTVVTYYFGSSEGSARKNEIFQGMKERMGIRDSVYRRSKATFLGHLHQC